MSVLGFRDLFPKVLLIVSRHYSVEWWDSREADAANNWGRVLYGDARIQVDEGVQPEKAATTLIHEVLHATLREMGLVEADGVPLEITAEDLVTRLANALTQVVRDNPQLVRFITTAIEEGRGEPHGREED